MAKKKQQEETHTAVESLNDSLTGLGQKVQKNAKMLTWIGIGVVAIVIGILVYIFAYRNPAIEDGNKAIAKADMAMVQGNDSIALVEYKNVADNYSYDAGNNAALMAAALLYDKGQYQEAINYLQKYDAQESIIGANAKLLEGDCYVNLDKLAEALKCYDEAIKQADENPIQVPFALIKKANVYREQKDYANETAALQQIVDEYPGFSEEAGIDVVAFLERSKASK